MLKVFLNVLLIFYTSSSLGSKDKKEGSSTEASTTGLKILKDFDELGGNKILYERLKKLGKGKQKIKIVQKRAVNRKGRHEVSFRMETSLIGAYVKTFKWGGGYSYHINPYFSLSLRGEKSVNTLTKEGEYVLDEGEKVWRESVEDIGFIPDMSWERHSLGVYGSWYFIYGKMNVFERFVAQFDMYTILGGGMTYLRREKTPFGSLGIGTAVWISKKMSSRLELFYRSFTSDTLIKKRRVYKPYISWSMGYLF